MVDFQYEIELMKRDDLESLQKLYKEARARMAIQGNPTQWGDFHPPLELLLTDIKTKTGYVVKTKDTHDIVGAFALIGGQDSTYKVIEDGNWLNEEPYYTIHHIANDGVHKGILKCAVDLALTKTDNVRIDTHADNTVMNQALKKYGFKRCGIIYVLNDSPRIAYQLCKNQLN